MARTFIFRTEEISNNDYEEQLSAWLEDNHPDKTIIGGEENGVFLVNEEDTAMLCLEYIEYN